MSDAYDGHPRQAGVGTVLVGSLSGYSISGLVEALVIDRRFVDEDGNRNRTGVEYDLRDTATGQPIHGARSLERSGGVSNGEEVVYHPASRNLNGGSFSKTTTRARDTDGDIVLVGFLNGSRERAVILGAIPRGTSSSYASASSNGERRVVRHYDTVFEVKEDGTASITRIVGSSPTKVTITPEGNIVVEGPTDRSFHVQLEGTGSIQLGMDAVHPAVKGDNLLERFNALVSDHNNLKDKFLSHLHSVFGAPTSKPAFDPSAGTSGFGSPITLPSAKSMEEDDLSDVVVLQ